MTSQILFRAKYTDMLRCSEEDAAAMYVVVCLMFTKIFKCFQKTGLEDLSEILDFILIV